jgi:chromosome segregation ATPase
MSDYEFRLRLCLASYVDYADELEEKVELLKKQLAGGKQQQPEADAVLHHRDMRPQMEGERVVTDTRTAVAALSNATDAHKRALNELAEERAMHKRTLGQLEYERAMHKRTLGQLEYERAMHKRTLGQLEDERAAHKSAVDELEDVRGHAKRKRVAD